MLNILILTTGYSRVSPIPGICGREYQILFELDSCVCVRDSYWSDFKSLENALALLEYGNDKCRKKKP